VCPAPQCLCQNGYNANIGELRMFDVWRERSGMKTYAQNFEDVILERLFQGENDGFYVDVGAWDPWYDSVTAHFYKKGWRGINIEPIEERALVFRRERPRDINLPVAISSQEPSVRLWVCDEASGLSTTDSNQAAELRCHGSALTERLVPSRGLNVILEEFAPTEITFLKIDVEGSEADVLATLDLARWRPRVILIEAIAPVVRLSDWSHSEERAQWSDWEPILLNARYLFAYFDGLNRFYLRAEDKQLMQCFCLPPGVFDHIENIDIEFQTTVLAKLEACENDRAKGLESIERLRAKLQRSRDKLSVCEQDRAQRISEIRAVKAKNDQLHAQLRGMDHDLRRMARAVRARLRNSVRKFIRQSGAGP